MLPKDGERVKLDEDRIKHWMGQGALPTDRVLRFLAEAGIAERSARSNPNKAEPGQKAQERLAAAKKAEEESRRPRPPKLPKPPRLLPKPLPRRPRPKSLPPRKPRPSSFPVQTGSVFRGTAYLRRPFSFWGTVQPEPRRLAGHEPIGDAGHHARSDAGGGEARIGGRWVGRGVHPGPG